jgi:ribosomal protein S27AE
MNNSTIVNRNWRYRNPEKAKAHYMVQGAIRKGTLIKSPCEKCSNEKVHAHHDDYTKPLIIRWLCAKCHKEHHTKLLYDSKSFEEREILCRKKYCLKVIRERLSNPLKQKIKDLKKEGLSYRKISDIVGLSSSQCFKLCNDTIYS